MMTKEKLKRILAFYLALNIIFEVVSPTAAYALTSGPGQPEMASFEPVATTEMVDAFSGDFNYNIPLLTVPGPNGGYPVNLAYHAGIGMEDEASWVGLGWNINPGVIARQMRGLPDDFSGEMVTKQLNMRPNRTVGINFGFPFTSVPEIWGFKLQQTLKLGATWNNYRGFGFAGGFSLSASKQNSSFSNNASLNYNSLSGETDLTAGFSLASSKNDAQNKFGASFTLSSLQGLKNLNFTYDRQKNEHKSGKYYDGRDADGNATYTSEADLSSRSTSGGVTFSSSSFVPPSEMPQTGFNISTSFSIGGDIVGMDNRFQINASYEQTSYPQNSIDFNAFGYLYADQRQAAMDPDNDNDNYKLMDFNREHEVTPTKDVPSMPAPISTYDIYMVNGQGIGGMFRPYRTDIGLLSDPEIGGDNIGGSIGVEIGLGYPTLNFGLNLALNYSKNYTGPWQKTDLWDDIKGRTYKGGTYFKSAGEIVADEDEENDFNMAYTNFPITTMVSLPNFSDLSLDPSDMEEMMSPLVDIRVNNTGGIISKDHYNTKRTRSQLMSYKTFSEIGQIAGYQGSWIDHAVYAENASPLTSSPLSNSNPGGNQIGEISVTNADGNHYIYALPAKNSRQKEVTFSIEKDNSGVLRNSPDDKIINYAGSQDNTTGNQQLDDHFFSSTEIPSYVHSYMLTAIVSPDYVDLKNDGLTEDDFGYWVKFNYTKTSSNYKWRSPFSGANYMKGYLSSDNDDKAGYTYGEKEIWYLNSIETKTHIANFTLDTRQDAKAAAAEDVAYTGSYNSSAVSSSNDVRELKKISLYSKADASKPLKEVNFSYTYDLCKGSLNSAASTHGKLMLQQVWFSYLGNEKGRLSPYIFDYHETPGAGSTAIAEENPDYSILNEDRWGNYKQNTFGVNSTVFPYTPQLSDYNLDHSINSTDAQIRNAYASAWSLKEITLPSGGKIIVDYEADDYAYVHDKAAMEMVRVVGFLPTPQGGSSLNISNLSMEMSALNEYLVFEINEPDKILTDADVKKYTNGISEVYFKVYIDLKKNGIEGIPKKDYVSGYAEIDAADAGIIATNFTESPGPYPTRPLKLGYVKVNKVSIHDVGGLPYTHPFRKAAWQYLKLQRPDVLFPGSNNSNSSGSGGLQFVKQVANSIIGALQSSAQLFIGFYSYCEAAGFGKEMDKSDNYPSFIRLNTPDGIKYGGGHRVKKVVITDTWQETKSGTNPTGEDQSVYGQEYTYRLPDGTSSGVASYEPLIGGEEIPYRKPIRYSSPYFIFKNENLYIEEPVGESFYPGASVGYSRVVVRNIDQTETPASTSKITKTREGVTVHEFYTTKDFPYSITRSSLDHEKFNPKITIPFIGSIGFENHGFSQWMNVVTNDMHGKAKSVATYDATSDINDPTILPVSKVDYIYNTDGSNNVSGKVTALFGDGYYRETSMGTTKDQYIDMRETYSVNMNQGLQTNLYLTFAAFVPIPVFIPVPIVDYSESLYKTVVSMHVTNQAGILMETRSFNEGSIVSAKNLMFDAYTGRPLMTSVTNDFDAPVYKYEYAAQWAYPGMGNAYKNDRAYLEFSTDASANLVLTNGTTSDLLFAGDEVLVNDGGTYKTGWVRSIVNGTTAELVKQNGQALLAASHTGFTGRVMLSGRRNQQAISNAAIVSLSNPVADRKYNLFSDYNLHLNPASVVSMDCGSAETRTYTTTYTTTAASSVIDFRYCYKGDECCDVILTFPLNNSISWSTVNLKKAGMKVYALDPSTGAVLSTGDITDGCGLTECMDGVLNASAAEFKDQGWTYDYPDVGDPDVKISSGAAIPMSTAAAMANNNPYRLGLAGIWRAEKSYAYQTERKQNTNTADVNTTKIQADGTFRDFVLFDWNKNAALAPLNNQWTQVNEVTRYSPYGFELENKNAIGIYTSALYGYKNSVQTAIAANAPYYETAYDGFEDYDAAIVNYTDPLIHRGGHVNLAPSSGSIPFDNANAHTGKRSLRGQGSQTLNITTSSASPSAGNYYFEVLPYKKYTISAWFKTSDGKPDISIPGAASLEVFSDNIKIEGWQKVDVNFTSTSSVITIQFKVNGTANSWYLDDVRLQPFKSTLKTFVYDQKTLWLLAELDNQNYATFYNYDEEGTLTQVKKETINGVQTLKTTRSNIKRQ